jgi:hypothetical protein
VAHSQLAATNEAAKKGNYGAFLKDLKGLEKMNALHKKSGLGVNIPIPKAWTAFAANAAAAHMKDPTLGKVAAASNSMAAAIKGLQATKAGLLGAGGLGTAAQNQAALGRLTATFNSEKAGSPAAKATLTQIHTLNDRMRELHTVNAKIATDQHTMAGFRGVEQAILTHPTVAHYDQSTHVTIGTQNVTAHNPQQIVDGMESVIRRANFSGEGTPRSSSGG